MDKNKHIVISLGGSLIVPNEIDVLFLKSFVSLLDSFVSKGFKFMIITGGGKICRNYNDAIKQIVDPTHTDLDWVGIASTRLNAEMLRVLFSDNAHESIILDPRNIPETQKSIMIGGGFMPGNSSDMAAIYGAHSIGAKKIVNLSNIDYAYDKDPNKFTDAVHIKEIEWADFRKLFPETWEPGLSTPFDPIAAKKAQEFGFEVSIMNGKNLNNLENYLNDEDFVGTVIKNLDNDLVGGGKMDVWI